MSVITFICLSISMAAFAPRALALSQAESDARKSTQASLTYAQQAANALVQHDFEVAVLDSMNDLDSAGRKNQLQLQEVQTQVQALSESFDSFSKSTVEMLSTSQAQLETLRDQFTALVQKQYTLSWLSMDAHESIANLAPTMAAALSRFENQCKIGRSDYQVDLSMQPGPHVVPQWSASISIGSGNSSVQFSGINQENPERSKTLSDITSYAEVGATIGFSSGTPPGIVVGVACTAVAVIASTASAIDFAASDAEIQGELSRADSYRAANWAKDSDISQFYRQSCQSLLDVLHPLQTDFATLVAGGAPADALHVKLSVQAKDMSAFEEKLKALRMAKCRRNIRTSTDLKADEIAAEAKACDMKLPSKLNDAADVEDKQTVANTSSAMTREALLKYAVWKSTMLFDPAKGDLYDAISEDAWENVQHAQDRAWDHLTQITSQVIQAKQSGSLDPATRLLVSDIESQKRIGKLQVSFVDLLAVAIHFAFSHATLTDWQNARTMFEAVAKPVFRDFQYLPAINTIKSHYENLVRIIEVEK